MYGGKFAFQNRLGKFQVQAPRGAYIRRGHLTEVFFALRFWGAYIWRGLYMEFYGILGLHCQEMKNKDANHSIQKD